MKKLTAIITAALLLTMSACSGTSTQNPDNPKTSDSSVSREPAPTDENGDVVIRLAVNKYMGYEVDKAIKEFNELDNGYHIQEVMYNHEQVYNSGNTLKTADMKLQMDIMNGNVVDMVADNAFEEISRYEILTEKGAFADLNPFLDGETGTARSELNAHILELHETDGKLCQIPMYFNIETVLGLREDVGTKENWTFDEMLMHWEAMPEGSVFASRNTKDYIYMHLIRGNLSAFVDYKNVTCSFDSPEFIRMLEFCNSFPETPNEYIDFNPDNMPIFIAERTFYGFYDYHHALHTHYFNLPEINYTFVGYPSEDGQGSFIDTIRERYSICASAHPEVQAGAWEFISYMLDEEFQYAHDSLYYELSGPTSNDGFPINTAAFERKAKELYEHEGEPYMISEAEGERDIGYLTRAEYERLVTFINSLSRMNSHVDRTTWNIIEEEIGGLFAGERTAEEVAKSIQGRVEILISERA